MSILEHLAQAAAIILIVELMVLIIIFLAISGGMVFGLRWVSGKTDPAFGTVNEYTALGAKYVHRGTDYVALPFVVAGRYGAMVKGTLDGIERRVRRSEGRQEGLAVANEAAKPVAPQQEPDVLV